MNEPRMWRQGDTAYIGGQPCVIVLVERAPKGPIPGRYTVKLPDGTVIHNHPSYLMSQSP